MTRNSNVQKFVLFEICTKNLFRYKVLLVGEQKLHRNLMFMWRTISESLCSYCARFLGVGVSMLYCTWFPLFCNELAIMSDLFTCSCRTFCLVSLHLSLMYEHLSRIWKTKIIQQFIGNSTSFRYLYLRSFSSFQQAPTI